MAFYLLPEPIDGAADGAVAGQVQEIKLPTPPRPVGTYHDPSPPTIKLSSP